GGHFERPATSRYGGHFERPATSRYGGHFERPATSRYGGHFERPASSRYGDRFERSASSRYRKFEPCTISRYNLCGQRKFSSVESPDCTVARVSPTRFSKSGNMCAHQIRITLAPRRCLPRSAAEMTSSRRHHRQWPR
ncbi:hypothetical protein, partial [Nocardia sp. NPDC049707]|uniref:hypothetical protein n=1 Tax=Nocardia sp. NPDC049707 TaxID=3154735 RepID=UPI003437969F